MTANIGAFTREANGAAVTSISWYNTTAPGTAIFTYQFPAASGAEIVVPALSLIAGENYTCIATDSVGNAIVNADITFIID